MPENRKAHRRNVDLEEIAPGQFLIHSPRVHSILKGEGTIDGKMFQLKTWRREGLMARLHQHGLTVTTLDDRILSLPKPPAAPSIGAFGWRSLTSANERFSYFDPVLLRWEPVEIEEREGVAGVSLREGWALRRRKGRGPASYYQAFLERGGGVSLRGSDETTAVLTGYAQAYQIDDRPLLIERREGKFLLPDVELPPPYRAIMRDITIPSPEGPLIEPRQLLLAQKLFGRLGLSLKEQPTKPKR